MSRSINEYTQFAHQFNYVGVGVTRGLHSSTAAIYSGSATYQKLGSFAYSVVVIKYDGGSKQYNLSLSDIFIPIGIGIGTVPIESTTQVVINTESTENPNVQVGDVVNFVGSNPSLGGPVLPSQRSRVVGVGTFYFIIEDNINSVDAGDGDASVTKLETFTPTGANAGIGATGNYRGAICLNDNNSNSGDFDDFVLRCHSANISGSGSGASVVGFNYENGGAFYGPPVTDVEEQSGDNGYIFNDDGVRGNFPNASGGIGSGANWKRLKNTYYKYSVPVYSTRYINGAGNGAGVPSCQSGRFTFDPFGNRMRINLNLVDADGNNNQDFFFYEVGRQYPSQSPPGVTPIKWSVKVTCPTRYSPIGIYSSERPYVWCTLNSRNTNGRTSNNSTPAAPGGNSTKIEYDLKILASNVNLDTEGGTITVGVGSPSAFDFGGLTNSEPCILEWFKTGGTGNTTKEVIFHASVDAGFNNNFMLQTQRIVDNNWEFDSGTASDVFKLKKVFEKNAMIHGSGNNKFNNFSYEMMPNLEYRVWNDAQNTARPYFKIINHPKSDQT